jgi:hypothetical protein
MHARQVRGRPEVNGMTLGFTERSRSGHRIIGHSGGTMYFHTDLRLDVDADVGFFISYNSVGRSGSIAQMYALWEAFVDRYYPYTPALVRTLPAAADDARRVRGLYMMSRRSDHSFGRLMWILGELTVSAAPDGTIVVDDYLNRQPRRYREIAPMLYREVDGQEHISFDRDPNSQLTLVPGAAAVCHKISWWEDKRLHLAASGFMALVMVLTLVLWPVASFVRLHYGQRLELGTRERRLRLAVRSICAFDLIVFACCIVLVLSAPRHLEMLNTRLDPWLLLLQSAGLLGMIATAVPVYNVWHLWRRRDTWWGMRVHETLIALACLVFAGLLVSWNFVNFNVRY